MRSGVRRPCIPTLVSVRSDRAKPCLHLRAFRAGSLSPHYHARSHLTSARTYIAHSGRLLQGEIGREPALNCVSIVSHTLQFKTAYVTTRALRSLRQLRPGPHFFSCAKRFFSARSSMPAANTSVMTTIADGMVIRTPTTKRARLLNPVTADQQSDASKRKDGRYPQANE